jgi:hypothetical protein
MNGQSHIGSLLRVFLIATVLAAACTTSPISTPSVEPIPVPSEVPVLSQSPELILAINKPPRKTSFPFVAQARSNNIETEYVELSNAPHAFDVYQNTQASKDTVKQAIEFLKTTLSP